MLHEFRDEPVVHAWILQAHLFALFSNLFCAILQVTGKITCQHGVAECDLNKVCVPQCLFLKQVDIVLGVGRIRVLGTFETISCVVPRCLAVWFTCIRTSFNGFHSSFVWRGSHPC